MGKSIRESIITDKGLAKYVRDTKFRIKISGEDSIMGTLMRFDDPETSYALKTKKGRIIPLIRGRTRVVIQPSQRSLDTGRTAVYIYDYYSPIKD
jgi:hypothetical protein